MKYEEIMQGVRADRIEAAIEAAAELYLEKGIENAKMTDIAQKSQLGVASLYRYFGTKQNFTIKVATHIWQRQLELYAGVYDSEYYHSRNGIQQVEELLKIFHVLFNGQPRFLRFVADFDAYIMREQIQPSDLKEYEGSILNSQSLMHKALEKGRADGTVRKDVDGDKFYFAASHALMAVSQKLAAGRILDSDADDGGADEIMTLIKMFVSYVSA